MQSVAGVPDAVVPRDSIAGWTWYARQMVGQLGWPLLIGACILPIAVLLRPGGRPRINRVDVVFLLSGLVVGYVFFSAVSLKARRYATQLMPPLPIAAMLAVARLLPERAAAAAAAALVAAAGLQTGIAAPVPQVAGYREAAQWI